MQSEDEMSAALDAAKPKVDGSVSNDVMTLIDDMLVHIDVAQSYALLSKIMNRIDDLGEETIASEDAEQSQIEGKTFGVFCNDSTDWEWRVKGGREATEVSDVT